MCRPTMAVVSQSILTIECSGALRPSILVCSWKVLCQRVLLHRCVTAEVPPIHLAHLLHPRGEESLRVGFMEWPQDGSLHSYRQYVQSLPLSEPPEAFGQHNNAEISSSLADTDTLMQTMIEVRGGGGGAAGGDVGETVFATCNTLLEKLPENLDWEEVRDRNEADSSPLKVCLLQERELRSVSHWCRRLRDTTYCYQPCGHPSRYCRRASKAGEVHL